MCDAGVSKCLGQVVAGRLRAQLDKAGPYHGAWRRRNMASSASSSPRCAGARGVAVPFSSSFLAGRLLNCLHHEVRSRREDAGSGVAAAAAG